MGATKSGIKTWEGAIIPFEIDPNFDNPNGIRDVIRNHYESQTNLRFVRRSRQTSFLRFVNGRLCESEVGFQGEPNQAVVCVAGGSVPTLIHEIGHALGLIHEHQRSDRDAFVTVHEGDIEPGKEHNFVRHGDSINLTDYDFGSIMHYPTNLFGVDGKTTIEPKDPANVLDGAATFTALDLASLNELYPHVGIVRRSDSGLGAAGRVSEIAVANDADPAALVTAVRTNEGTLRLIRWTVNAAGGIRRQEPDSGNQVGAASSIAIARGRRFVTAVRTAEGTLKLISWNVNNSEIEELKNSGDQAGRVSLVRLLALTPDLFVTAVRDNSGELKMITWRLESNDGFRRLESSEAAGDVSEISLVRVRQSGSEHLVATTVRTAEERVKTIVWRIRGNGAVDRRGDSGSQIREGSLIESVMHAPTGLLVVSCRTAEGTLKLITLSVSPNGTSVIRRRDSGDQAGAISRNALLERPVGALSAVRANGGNIRLIRWQIDANGQLTRLGDSTLGQAGEIGIVRLASDTGRVNAPIVTCVQTEDRDLRLISWDDEPQHGEVT